MQTTSRSLGWKLTPQTELFVPGVTVLHEVITCINIFEERFVRTHLNILTYLVNNIMSRLEVRI